MFEPDGSIILDKDFVNPYEDGAASEAIEAYNARGYNPNRDTKTGRFTFGTGTASKSTGGDGGSLDRDMTQVDTSYRGSHGAPNRDDGVSSPGHDLTNTFPSDIYSDRAARLYSSGYEAIDREAIGVIQSIHNKPNEKVMIYRAVPNKASIEVIHPGDWVAITKGYADYHGESNLNNEYKVLIREVRAKDIWNNADSIQEWGYDPTVDKNYLDDVITNGRGYNPNRDPKTGMFTFGVGGKIAKGKKMKYSDFEAMADAATIEQAQNPAWAMKQIYKKQGFNGKPDIVSDEVFQTIEGETQYRGIVEGRGNGEFKRLFKEGPTHYPGTGIFGNGTYITNSAKIARRYSSSDSLLNMKIKPGAKSVEYMDIFREGAAVGRKMADQAVEMNKSKIESERLLSIKLMGLSRSLGDPGVYAASQGYDYMAVTGQLAQDPQSILFNRSAVIVNEQNFRSTL